MKQNVPRASCLTSSLQPHSSSRSFKSFLSLQISDLVSSDPCILPTCTGMQFADYLLRFFVCILRHIDVADSLTFWLRADLKSLCANGQVIMGRRGGGYRNWTRQFLLGRSHLRFSCFPVYKGMEDEAFLRVASRLVDKITDK